MKNPITFFLFLMFIFINIIDLGTAQFIKAGESNPLFLLVGNFWLVGFLKVGIIIVLGYYINRNIYPSNFMYYLTILILVLGTLSISLATWSNIYGIMNPSVIEAAAKTTNSEKVQGYTIFISVIYIIPMLFNLLIFWMYDKSLKKAVIDNEFFKKLPWWHL